MKKSRIWGVLLAVVMMLMLCTSPAVAASDEAVNASEALYNMNLFQGTGVALLYHPRYVADAVTEYHQHYDKTYPIYNYELVAVGRMADGTEHEIEFSAKFVISKYGGPALVNRGHDGDGTLK